MILDDIIGRMEIDRRNMLVTARSFPEQCEEAIKIGREFSKKLRMKKPKRVFVCGMGGSAIAGDILRTWLKNSDINVIRSYDIPGYISKEDLVFVSSYSGNTEETLSMFGQAVRKKYKLIVISSGGKLERKCKEAKIPLIRVPAGMQPRAAIAYLFFPMVVVLKKLRFFRERADLKKVVENLREVRNEISPEVRTRENMAKRIAIRLRGKIPLIYGFGRFEGVALRTKAQFNENSKAHSFCETLPEMNHNAIMGWKASRELNKKLAVIFIRDKEESEEMTKRVEFTEDVVKNAGGSVIEIHSIYKSTLSRILSVMYTLDFASIYLAILHRKDPSDTELITDLKFILRECDKI